MGCAVCKRSSVVYDISDMSPDWELTMLTDVDFSNFMTAEECDMLKNRWRYIMEDPKSRNFGNIVFAKFFLYVPDAQRFFFQERKGTFLTQYEWQKHPLFPSHIRRVVNEIDNTISLLRSPENLEQRLARIRRIHQQYSGIKLIYAQIFVKVLEDSVARTLGREYTPDYRHVFRKFLLMLYTALFNDLEHAITQETTIASFSSISRTKL